MFAAIHLRNKWILRNVRCHTFALPISLFLFIVPHVLPRPPRRRRGRFIVPVPTNTPEMALQYTIPHPRTPTKRHCDTSYCTHETPTKWHHNTSCRTHVTPTKWHCVGAIWQYNIYLFLGIAHLFISY